MTIKNNQPKQAAELRRQAEVKLSGRKKKTAALAVTESDTWRLIHELEVHQIELEMQNEELLRSRAQVEVGLRQYTDLYDFAPVGYFMLARDGTIHKNNLDGANLLGVERGALIKRRFGLFVSVESRPIFSAFLEKVFATSDGKETCDVALQKDGSAPLWVHIEATCSVASGGEREVCHVVVSDITERKQTEEVLTASEIRYRRLFEAARDGIMILNADTGVVVDVNPFLVELIGYSREQFLGKAIWEIGLFKDIAGNRSHFAELQEKEFVQYEDMPLETARGRSISVEFVSHVYQIGSRKVIQCNVRDITERMQTEKKALRQLEELRRWQEVTLGREDRNRQLKHEVNDLLVRLGEAIRYPSQESTSDKQRRRKGEEESGRMEEEVNGRPGETE